MDEMVRGTIEETLNALLDAEADEMCKAQRYERSPDRVDTRTGHYTRKLHTKAGEVEVNLNTDIYERHNYGNAANYIGIIGHIFNIHNR